MQNRCDFNRTSAIKHGGLTFLHSNTLRCELVVLFFLAAEFHRFLTVFSDLPGSNFAILVQLRNMGGVCTQPRLRRMSSARDTIGHEQSAMTNDEPARASSQRTSRARAILRETLMYGKTHLFPKRAWPWTRISSSSGVQLDFLRVGSRWLNQRSRHCFPTRPSTRSAISDHRVIFSLIQSIMI